MSLPALATVEDLEARLGRTLTGTDLARAEALLDDTSAAVRNYTGQEFTAASSAPARVRAKGLTVRLPQRPVTAVDSVDDVDGNTIGFTWYADDVVTLTAVPLAGWVDVTYDHGFAEIPADLVAVVCNITMRAYGTPADQAGFTGESIGTYSYTVGGAAAAGALGMLADEKKVLLGYGPRVGAAAWVAY